MYVLLGIPNCDSVRKAKKYLEANNYNFKFRDIRTEPLSSTEWQRLVAQDADQQLVNWKSPNFKKLGLTREQLQSEKAVVQVLLQNPTLMKRPSLLRDGKICCIGWSETFYHQLPRE